MRVITKIITARGTMFIVRGYADETVDCTWAKMILPSLNIDEPDTYVVYLFKSDSIVEVYDAVEVHKSGEES